MESKPHFFLQIYPSLFEQEDCIPPQCSKLSEHINSAHTEVDDLSSRVEGRKEGNVYLTTHSTHFIYGYMASDIWLRTILIVRKETRCRYIGYSFLLTARYFYMHQPTDRIAHTTAFVTPVVEHWLEREIAKWVHPMKDRSDDPSHHERTLLPRSYISLPSSREGQMRITRGHW